MKRRILDGKCEACQAEGDVEIHHIRSLTKVVNRYKKKKKNVPDWVGLMDRMHRKTLVLCPECHYKLHRGKPIISDCSLESPLRRNGARRVRGEGLTPLPHRDSVQGFLEYCRLRSFRRPESDNYGWARLCQTIANFLGADGTSIGVDDVARLDRDNGDNGVYLIRDWKIVGRRFFDGEEQNCYDLQEFLMALDDSQPENQKLGHSMIEALRFHGLEISDVSWNYQYEMAKRAENGIAARPFEIGKFYADCRNRPSNIVKIVEKPYMEAIVEKDGEEMKVPRFVWKDGSESILMGDDRMSRRAILSTEEVSS